mmetsp:Transcript_3793/g.5891  ORF Transcript_3793/g.5891 Transcript_3793/m.5891 type:complete len:224 (+) Transcript_3793:82-753(+)|eukprot:CAMPEP_0185018264 /NCGR_PEP_ID=MMETSP1103-20130426/1042_1 /TAXON_ID=36769 /ORGANISM="Paraphysomonas bandaiensis, Strain Caron Lab Isolate" /LENGTH=223 /DNA_ID=CAMNT_0027548011 /DNA_START=50 /DNA_END=721 /DNA_ORIENTATION=+
MSFVPERISVDGPSEVNSSDELVKMINHDALEDFTRLQLDTGSNSLGDMAAQGNVGNEIEGYNSDSDASMESSGTRDGKDDNGMDSPPTSKVPSPPATSPVARRMSMRMPSYKSYSDCIVSEEENAAFLEQLTHIITEFPVPPSGVHTNPQQAFNSAVNNLSDIVGASSKTAIKAVSGGWGAVTKLAGKLGTVGNSPMQGSKEKRRHSGSEPTVNKLSEEDRM